MSRLNHTMITLIFIFSLSCERGWIRKIFHEEYIYDLSFVHTQGVGGVDIVVWEGQSTTGEPLFSTFLLPGESDISEKMECGKYSIRYSIEENIEVRIVHLVEDCSIEIRTEDVWGVNNIGWINSSECGMLLDCTDN